MRLPIYVIGMPTGQMNEDGVEVLILIDVKLSKMAAEQVQFANPGSTIRKMVADKEPT